MKRLTKDNFTMDALQRFCGENGGYFSRLFTEYANGNLQRGVPFVCAAAGGEQGFCAALTSAYRDRAAAVEFCGCTVTEEKMLLS
ncbi:MAG: hypothetical protein ACI4SH_04690 [Candidatus Scatosoma sp.]